MSLDTLTYIKKRIQKCIQVTDQSIETARKNFDSLYLEFLSDFSLTQKSVKLNHCESFWITPTKVLNKNVLLFFHGGAFMIGSTAGHLDFIGRLATGTGSRVLSVDYRLMPEHGYPAAIDDGMEAYRYLLDNGHSASDIIFVGFTAGGTLALSTLIQLKQHHMHFPKACVCISPVTNFSFNYPSIFENEGKDWINISRLEKLRKMYAGDDIENPLISPIYADLSGLSPMLIQVGSHELLLDDAKQFANRAKNSGVKVTLSIWENMIHGWPAFATILNEGKKTIEEIINYANEV